MTRLALPGKMLGAGFLVAACLMTAAGTALSGGQSQPQKKIQIKIVVDGKEIDLGDAQLWDLIAAAQRKAATDKSGEKAGGKPDQPADAKQKAITPHDKVRVHVRDGDNRTIVIDALAEKALADKLAERMLSEKLSAVNRSLVRQLALSPDGKVLVHGHGTKLQIIDAATGQVLSELGNKDAAHTWLRLLGQGEGARDGGKPDPRIEDLVKQAEAIKPGAGAAVREALQGHGRNVIVLSIEDGKVLQLSGDDAKKAIEKGIRVEVDIEGANKALRQYLNLGTQKTTEKRRPDAKSGDTKPEMKQDVRDTKPAKVAPQTAPASSDIEALIRQVERMNIELNELRRRLDAGKK